MRITTQSSEIRRLYSHFVLCCHPTIYIYIFLHDWNPMAEVSDLRFIIRTRGRVCAYVCAAFNGVLSLFAYVLSVPMYPKTRRNLAWSYTILLCFRGSQCVDHCIKPGMIKLPFTIFVQVIPFTSSTADVRYKGH